MIAFDTNLLIYAHLPSTQEHHSAKQAIEKAFGLGPCGIALPSLSEFWGVVTQLRPGRTASSLQEAKSFLESLQQEGPLRIWHPTLGFHQRLMDIAYRLNIHGVRIFDLQIGLLALENGATQIWTHDKNFVSLGGLQIIDPLG